MNNNLLFLGLLGVGAYMLTRTKTAAPPVLNSGNSGQAYVPQTTGTTTPIRTTPTPGQILTDVTNTATDLANAWGEIKGAFGGSSVQPSVPPSVPTSTPSSVQSSLPSGSQGIAAGEPYPPIREPYFMPEQPNYFAPESVALLQ